MSSKESYNNKEAYHSEQLQLIWPDDGEEIKLLLQTLKDDSSCLYRSTVVEQTTVDRDRLVFINPISGIPYMVGDMLNSYAFAMGGWDLTQKNLQDSKSVHDFIRKSDAIHSSFKSPLIWTTPNINYAYLFKPNDQDQILALFKLNSDRVKVIDLNPKFVQEEKAREEEYLKLVDAVMNRKPYCIYDDLRNLAEETMKTDHNEVELGPYIERSEIIAFIRIKIEEDASFKKNLSEVYSS